MNPFLSLYDFVLAFEKIRPGSYNSRELGHQQNLFQSVKLTNLFSTKTEFDSKRGIGNLC